VKSGRSERIRTSGPCLPKTVLYQREPPQTIHFKRFCQTIAHARLTPREGKINLLVTEV
jgi:hypothetical protein